MRRPRQLVPMARLSAFGVSLIQTVDIYQQSERAVKYAVLFIILTFLVFFLWEVFRATLLHPMQYAFVGFALCVFYLLLVSISERAGFDVAYGISATVTTLLIAGYARAILSGTQQSISVLPSLSAPVWVLVSPASSRGLRAAGRIDWPVPGARVGDVHHTTDELVRAAARRVVRDKKKTAARLRSRGRRIVRFDPGTTFDLTFAGSCARRPGRPASSCRRGRRS